MNKIEEKFGLKLSQAIALLIIVVLNLIWIVCSTITAIKANDTFPVYQIINIVMFLIAVFYAVYGYKKPHGNLMKYLLLCSAAFTAVQYITHSSVVTYPVYVSIVMFAVAILKTYMAGRLNKIVQNVVISTVVLLCECVVVFYIVSAFVNMGAQISFVLFMSLLGPVVLWLAIVAAYFTRYKLHKEAGLEDKK